MWDQDRWSTRETPVKSGKGQGGGGTSVLLEVFIVPGYWPSEGTTFVEAQSGGDGNPSSGTQYVHRSVLTPSTPEKGDG